MGESFARNLSLVLLLTDPGWSDACEQSTDPDSHVYHPWVARTPEGGSCFCSIQPSVSTVSVRGGRRAYLAQGMLEQLQGKLEDRFGRLKSMQSGRTIAGKKWSDLFLCRGLHRCS